MIKILKETKGKDSVVKDNSKSKTSKELPETGSKQESNSNSLVFSLIALLSSLLLLKRKTIKISNDLLQVHHYTMYLFLL